MENRKIYIHKNQINLFKNGTFGTMVESIQVRIKPAPDWIGCEVSVPEKAITISEKEFDEAVKKFFVTSTGKDRTSMQEGTKMQDHLRDVLFANY